jgi:hypothetical protein
VDGAVARRVAMALFLSRPLGALAQAADGPQPPCGGTPQPFYTPPGAAPAIWTQQATVWTASACTGWSSARPTLLVALAGSFRHEGGAADLLAVFGRIPPLVRYPLAASSGCGHSALATDRPMFRLRCASPPREPRWRTARGLGEVVSWPTSTTAGKAQ